MIPRVAYGVGWAILGLCILLFIVGLVQNPVQARRQQFELALAEAPPLELNLDLNAGSEFEAWQQSVSGRPRLWQPLMEPPKIDAPPPELQKMLGGVEPTRNTMGSGDTLRIQIKVDGKREWFSKGHQVKGCTIQDINDNEVMFTVVQDGRTHGIRVPRR
ncbi:MAG TPA: hypothetical protein PLJ47_05480 [Candidatus Hydrogenedentes bacterium]|nr:hypothetical protein [Candidatus Hydrogenedentota bacterium]